MITDNSDSTLFYIKQTATLINMFIILITIVSYLVLHAVRISSHSNMQIIKLFIAIPDQLTNHIAKIEWYA